MKRCKCCRQTWPIEFYGVVRGLTGTAYRRGRCHACKVNCGPARRRRAVERTAAYKARLRSDVEAVRAARVQSRPTNVDANPPFVRRAAGPGGLHPSGPRNLM